MMSLSASLFEGIGLWEAICSLALGGIAGTGGSGGEQGAAAAKASAPVFPSFSMSGSSGVRQGGAKPPPPLAVHVDEQQQR